MKANWVMEEGTKGDNRGDNALSRGTLRWPPTTLNCEKSPHLEGRKVDVDQLLGAGQILQKEGSLLYYCKDLLLCLHVFLLLHFTLLRFLGIFSALLSHYSLRLEMMFLTIYKSDILLFYGNDH